MNVKRTTFWILLAVFAGLFTASFFYFPYNRQRLYRAIPSNAVLISEHERLGDRWQTLIENPVGQTLMRSMGVKEKNLAGLAGDPQVDRLMKRLAPRDTVLAYVPSLGASQRPAWVLSSWVGSGGQLRKLELTFGLIPGFCPIQLNGGRKAWVLDTKSTANAGDRLSITVVEGVLLGCLSSDPLGVRYLMERIDAGSALLPELDSAPGRKAAHFSVPDRGWARWQSVGGQPSPVRVWTWSLTEIGKTRLAGSVTGDVGLKLRDSGAGAAGLSGDDVNSVVRVLGDSPGITLMASYADLRPHLMSLMSTGVAEAVETLLATNVVEDGPAFLGLGNSHYSGRLFGLKVPTLMAGVKMQDAGKAVEMISAGLDRLNARYGYGLIGSRLPTGGNASAFIVMEGVMPSFYKRLAREERPAFAICGSWLVFASNLKALEKMVAQSEVPGTRSPIAGWEGKSGDNRPAAYLWADLNATADALNKGLAVYTLLSLAQAATEGGTQSANPLAEVRGWVETLKPLKTLAATWESSSPEPKIRFVLGEPGPP